MDNRIQLNETVLRGKFTLPADAAIVNVMDLDQSVRQKIAADAEDDITITRASVRATSRVVNAGFGDLIRGFREPITIPNAVAHYCRDDPLEAEQVLEEALPILLDLVRGSILVSEHDDGLDAVEFIFEIGDQVLGYKVRQRLQLFSDSEVYQVCNSEGSVFALKIARPNCPQKITDQLKFEAEIIKIQTDDFLSLIEKSEYQGCFLLVMSWVSGVRVDQVAAEYRQAHDWQSLKQLLINIVMRYQDLHRKGILHGDIHPGNVLVDAFNAAHLIDFGNAVNVKQKTPSLTHRAGVAFYFEPEYAESIIKGIAPPAVTERAEQFSLSALLYFLATGNYYDDFELEQSALYQSIASASPKPFLKQGQPAWPSLEACLFKGLEIDPQRRFANLELMIVQLNNCGLAASPQPEMLVVNDANQFIARSKKIVSVDDHLFNSDFEVGPSCSVNGGAAGIAYALLKLACCHEVPELLVQAELWLKRARTEQGHDMAFMNTKYRREYEMVGCASVHHAAPGISFISLLLNMAKNDPYKFQSEFSQFVEEVSKSCDSNDTTLGKLSAVLALLELHEHLTDSDMKPFEPLLMATGNKLLTDIWQGLDNGKPIGDEHQWKNLGFAHGWAGLFYTTLLWTQQFGVELPTNFYRRISELTACLYPQGRGLVLDWLDEEGKAMGAMAGWCNGSAGVVYLYCLLYQHDQNPKWLTTARGLAWNVWESQDSPVDLCCGIAGRIFALLKMASVDTESTAWHFKAKRLAQSAIEHAEKIKDEEHPSHSLFKGQLGVALAIEAVLSEGKIGMPMMGMS